MPAVPCSASGLRRPRAVANMAFSEYASWGCGEFAREFGDSIQFRDQRFLTRTASDGWGTRGQNPGRFMRRLTRTKAEDHAVDDFAGQVIQRYALELTVS